MLGNRIEWQGLRTRIAPTASGYLHKGNLFSALFTWILARNNSGSVQLRIDDLDLGRSRPEFVEGIIEQLYALGIDWDLGPKDLESHQLEFSQPHRFTDYLERLRGMIEFHKIVYACKCSRKDWNPNGERIVYPGSCRTAGLEIEDTSLAWRLRTDSDSSSVCFSDLNQGEILFNLKNTVGDFIVKRKDQIPAYHLVSVLEDDANGIDFVVRGLDLTESTATQIFLSRKLGLSFEHNRFLHHPLIVDRDGKKLNKSDGAKHLSPKELHSNSVRTKLFKEFKEWAGLGMRTTPSTATEMKDLILECSTE